MFKLKDSNKHLILNNWVSAMQRKFLKYSKVLHCVAFLLHRKYHILEYFWHIYLKILNEESCYLVQCIKCFCFHKTRFILVLCQSQSIVGLKETDCQILLQQRWVYLGSAEKSNSWSPTMGSHVQGSAQQGKENTFIEGKMQLGGRVLARKEE